MVKIVFLLATVLLIIGVTIGFCDFYEYTDLDGVVHFTDNPEAIPKSQTKYSEVGASFTQATDFEKNESINSKAKERYLPVHVDYGWQFVDADQKLTITASRKVVINGKEHIVMDWTVDGLLLLKSEYWLIREDGVYVGGTSILGSETIYERPYLLMKHDAKVGMKWSWTDGMNTVVERKEKINTRNCTFNTLKVVSYVNDVKVERWYAKNVGLIKFATYTKFGNRYLLNKEDLFTSVVKKEERQLEDNAVIVHQSSEAKGDALTVHILSANWQNYDFDSTKPSIVSWELLSDGTFRGSFRNPDPYWQYSGKWWIKDRKIYSKSTVSLNGLDDSLTDDVDEVLEIKDDYMIIKCETDGTIKKFWRQPNKSLEKKMNF